MSTTTVADPPATGSGSRRRAWWPGIVLAALVTALTTGWGLTRDPLEPYYAASVRAMASNWHAFLFGAFDPAATVTMDKLPGAFWVQALLVRVLGPASWVMVAPQVVEMTAAVVVLALAVRALAGPAAGTVAAVVLALSPAAVAVGRGNVADPLMILGLVAATWATARALSSGRAVGWLALAGVFVGIAFQAKMAAAWLVLPALAVAFLVAGPGTWPRRIGATAAGGVVTAVVSLAWTVAVSLVPAAARPWVDGSTDDSLWQQTFVYNGLGRLGAQNPLQVLAGQGLALTAPGTDAGPSWDRLVVGALARSAGWLLPMAVLAVVVGLWALRRAPRTDPRRAAYLLFGLWLLAYGVAFTAGSVVNVYYVASLAPAIAGVLGVAFVHVRDVLGRTQERGTTGTRVVTAVAVVGTVAYGAVLVLGSERPLVTPVVLAVVLGLVAVGLVAAARRGGLVVGLVAVLVLPVAATAWLLALGGGAFDTPFETAREARAVRVLLVAAPRFAAATLPGLERARGGTPDLMAVQSSAVASVFAYPTGDEVLPIGGFTGTGPSPTLDQLRADVAAGRFHTVLSFPSTDPRLVWVDQHCRALPSKDPTFRVHEC